MAVGDFQAEFLRRAVMRDLFLEPNQRVPGLTGKAHREPSISVPAEVVDRLAVMFEALGGVPALLDGKRPSGLPLDFVLAPTTIIELDEFQHFTSARLRSLDFYEGVNHGLDLDRYRRLCRQHAGRADLYGTAQPTVDFPFSGGRPSQRAFLDAARDLIGPVLGYRVIRIASPNSDVDLAIVELMQALSM